MPAPRKEQKRESASVRSEISAALRMGRKELRSRRAAAALSRTFYIPALGGALWIGLSRFTLLDLPRWPVLVVPGLWALALLIWIRRQRPTESECARFADNRLGLDERLTTYLELEGRAKYGMTPYSSFIEKLGADTALVLKQAEILPSPRARLRPRPWQATTLVVSLALLLGAVLVPTTLDAVRAEKKALEASLISQAASLESLRAELVTRPGLPDSMKQDLDRQLRDLEAKLRSGQIDRSDALAALAAAEEQIRGLMPDSSSSEFEPLIRAAQLIQAGASQAAEWDPSLATSADDLGRAAEALQYSKTYVNQFTPAQARTMANSLERAADVSEAKDPGLAQHLLNSGAGLRGTDQDTTKAELDAAAKGFQQAQSDQQSAAAVEKTLARLSDGRQEIARAGTTTTKRQQVGFRRPQQGQQANGGSRSATPGAQASSGPGSADGATPGATASTVGSNSQLGQVIGQNQPAFGVKPGAGSGGSTTSSQQGGSNGNPSTSGQGGGAGSGQPGVSQPGAGSGAGPANGGGSGNNAPGGSGAVTGQISGPVRVGGASGGGNAAGNGTGSDTSGAQQQTSAQDTSADQVYVPGLDSSERSGLSGQASPEQPNSVSGRVGTGQAGSQQGAEPGAGQLNTIRTPYSEVIGEYSQQATQALDREYVPPDAKQYVRDYFTALAK